MQVTETQAQGLKRAYKVVLPMADLAARLDKELHDLKDKVRINGFRPGKVPMSHLKRVYGRSVMGEVVQNAVNEANRKIVEDNQLRLAQEPKIDLAGDAQEIEKIMAVEADLAFTVSLEVLPKFDIGSFDDVVLERLVTDIPDAEVDDAISRMASQNATFAPKEDGAAAAKGDQVTIDFLGKIDDVAFEGGAAQDTPLVLGSGQFIPGFEDQLIGAKTGDQRQVKVTFPEAYQAAHLAGKEAVFDVTVKAIAVAGEVKVDDEFAKGFGLENLDKLKEAIRANIQREYSKASREKIKRGLLDALDKKYSFELPEGLVEQEFSGIWAQVEAEQKQTGKSFADEGTTEDAARADYRKIAERRVRLGLVLAEVGEKAGVKVLDEEISQGVVERARQFPGQEKAVWDYFQKNPEAVAQIRAPIYEEKVVDHILSQAKVTDKTVSKDELFKADEPEKA
ncbi:MAG: trigger factor [Alphaproteobacteria bacterium]|nr:trigger factor [Alphaproteobacteria bacterium]